MNIEISGGSVASGRIAFGHASARGESASGLPFLLKENILTIHLESKSLVNTQQMEVAASGPDGATHLIICTGLADLDLVSQETYTFVLSRRQFVSAIASGALSTVQTRDQNSTGGDANLELGANLVSIEANFDDDSGQVKVIAEVGSSVDTGKLAISYNISILAELPMY